MKILKKPASIASGSAIALSTFLLATGVSVAQQRPPSPTPTPQATTTPTPAPPVPTPTPTPAIAPPPVPVPVTSQERLELQQLRDNSQIDTRVREEVDRAFSRTTTLLNFLVILLILLPIGAGIVFWMIRRIVVSEIVEEVKKQLKELGYLEQQISRTQQHINSLVTEFESQVTHAEQRINHHVEVLENTQPAPSPMKILVEESSAKVNNVAEPEDDFTPSVTSFLNLPETEAPNSQEKRILELARIVPISEEAEATTIEQQIEGITTQLETIKSDNPDLLMTEQDYIQQGNECLQNGDYQNAIAAYDQAVNVASDAYIAWLGRAEALKELQRYEEAIACCDEAIQIKPDFYQAWYNRARYYALQGKHNLAVENLAHVVRIRPEQYKSKATTDAAFEPIRQDEAFQTLVA